MKRSPEGKEKNALYKELRGKIMYYQVNFREAEDE